MGKRQVYFLNKLSCLQGVVKWSAGIAVGMISFLVVGDGFDDLPENIKLVCYGTAVAAAICVLAASLAVLYTLHQIDVDSRESSDDDKSVTKLKAKSKASAKGLTKPSSTSESESNSDSVVELNIELETEAEAEAEK